MTADSKHIAKSSIPKRNSREIRRIFSKGYKLTDATNFGFAVLHISIFWKCNKIKPKTNNPLKLT
jgi:hypothetical protein